MDTWSQGLAGSDEDAEMMPLVPEDISEQSLDVSDEVEHLQNRYMFSSKSGNCL